MTVYDVPVRVIKMADKKEEGPPGDKIESEAETPTEDSTTLPGEREDGVGATESPTATPTDTPTNTPTGSATPIGVDPIQKDDTPSPMDTHKSIAPPEDGTDINENVDDKPKSKKAKKSNKKPKKSPKKDNEEGIELTEVAQASTIESSPGNEKHDEKDSKTSKVVQMRLSKRKAKQQALSQPGSPEGAGTHPNTSQEGTSIIPRVMDSIRKSFNLKSRRPETMRLTMKPQGIGGSRELEGIADEEEETALPVELTPELKAWFEAVNKSENENIEKLLKDGIEVNSRNEIGFTAMHVAAANADGEVIDLLLKNKADINIQGKQGQTPLVFAVLTRQVDIVEKLIAAGVNTNRSADVPNQTLTALHAACQNSDLEMVNLLLKNEADVNATRKGRLVYELTPLHDAADGGNPLVIKSLMDAGCKVNAVSSDSITALHKAAAKGHTDAVQVLLENGADVSKFGDDGNGPGATPLHVAALSNSIPTVQALLEAGADVNKSRMFNGRSKTTVLHFAAKEGNDKLVEIFVDAGANVDAQDKDGFTALHNAVRSGHVDIARYLIEKKCNIDLGAKTRQATHQTPLHFAIRYGHFDIAELLITSGANVNTAERTTTNETKKKKVPTATLR